MPYLAETDEQARQWQDDMERTVIERDLAQFGVSETPGVMRRFWATHDRAELDLMVNWQARRYGFEFKYGDAPFKKRRSAKC